MDIDVTTKVHEFLCRSCDVNIVNAILARFFVQRLGVGLRRKSDVVSKNGLIHSRRCHRECLGNIQRALSTGKIECIHVISLYSEPGDLVSRQIKAGERSNQVYARNHVASIPDHVEP